MEKWSKKDEEKLLDSFNGGIANWHHISRTGLSGRFDAKACREKFTALQQKRWNKEDDAKLWKSRNLMLLRPHQVSATLRRPVSSIKDRLIELENMRKEKELFTGIDKVTSRIATKTDDEGKP